MGCNDARDLLALLAGGDLVEAERIAVEGHVAVCGACARELDRYREARAALSLLRTEPPPPPGGWKGFRAELERELFPRKRWTWGDELLRHAALLLLGVALGVAVHHARRASEPADAGRGAALPALAPVREIGAGFLPTAPRPEPRPPLLRGGFHLPRVEALPAGSEKEF
jgi:hypothetical protein